jgi:hypothetical protein
MSRPAKIQAALRLMGNPYASLSFFDDAAEAYRHLAILLLTVAHWD